MSGSVFTPPVSGTYAGMTEEQLRAALVRAQAALLEVVTGGKPIVVSYSQGEGQRMVTFSRTNEGQLRNMIRELIGALGLDRRRAVGVRFG